MASNARTSPNVLSVLAPGARGQLTALAHLGRYTSAAGDQPCMMPAVSMRGLSLRQDRLLSVVQVRPDGPETSVSTYIGDIEHTS